MYLLIILRKAFQFFIELTIYKKLKCFLINFSLYITKQKQSKAKQKQSKSKAKAKAKMALLNTTDNLQIKQVRGKYVISTMPKEWEFGQANTLLECPMCMRDATWRGVLIGPCDACSELYNDVAGIGFPEKEYSHAMPGGSASAPFGYFCGFGREVCRKINELLLEVDAIPVNAQHIKHADAYSFYGAASMYESIIESSWATHNIGLRYNCDCDSMRLSSILRVLSTLAEEFDMSADFYEHCEKMEKEWTECKHAGTQEDVDAEIARKELDRKKHMHECHYCGNIRETLLCGGCKSIRYCSVACQHRDWKMGGAYSCADGEPSSPHKECCAYLARLRSEQKAFEKSSAKPM